MTVGTAVNVVGGGAGTIDGGDPSLHKQPLDLQALLYKFEHALLMYEHETRILQKLLGWCESAVERLHHDVDDR